MEANASKAEVEAIYEAIVVEIEEAKNQTHRGPSGLLHTGQEEGCEVCALEEVETKEALNKIRVRADSKEGEAERISPP